MGNSRSAEAGGIGVTAAGSLIWTGDDKSVYPFTRLPDSPATRASAAAGAAAGSRTAQAVAKKPPRPVPPIPKDKPAFLVHDHYTVPAVFMTRFRTDPTQRAQSLGPRTFDRCSDDVLMLILQFQTPRDAHLISVLSRGCHALCASPRAERLFWKPIFWDCVSTHARNGGGGGGGQSFVRTQHWIFPLPLSIETYRPVRYAAGFQNGVAAAAAIAVDGADGVTIPGGADPNWHLPPPDCSAFGYPFPPLPRALQKPGRSGGGGGGRRVACCWKVAVACRAGATSERGAQREREKVTHTRRIAAERANADAALLALTARRARFARRTEEHKTQLGRWTVAFGLLVIALYGLWSPLVWSIAVTVPGEWVLGRVLQGFICRCVGAVQVTDEPPVWSSQPEAVYGATHQPVRWHTESELHRSLCGVVYWTVGFIRAQLMGKLYPIACVVFVCAACYCMYKFLPHTDRFDPSGVRATFEVDERQLLTRLNASLAAHQTAVRDLSLYRSKLDRENERKLNPKSKK